MRIAVCDDNPNAVEVFGRYATAIIEYAFVYEFYQDPEEMLAAYAGQEPDMYILDIEMPGMDGLAVAQEIRKRNSKALIVFLTSYTKYMPDVFEVVTFDFIKKPITVERLRLLLERGNTRWIPCVHLSIWDMPIGRPQGLIGFLLRDTMI